MLYIPGILQVKNVLLIVCLKEESSKNQKSRNMGSTSMIYIFWFKLKKKKKK